MDALETQVTNSRCVGCWESGHDLIEGMVLPRFAVGTPTKVHLCQFCWHVIDHADPVTGSWGAACCDVRRDTAPMGEAYIVSPLCPKPFNLHIPSDGSREALKRILVILESTQDMGPVGMGWKSTQLQADIAVLELLITGEE